MKKALFFFALFAVTTFTVNAQTPLQEPAQKNAASSTANDESGYLTNNHITFRNGDYSFATVYVKGTALQGYYIVNKLAPGINDSRLTLPSVDYEPYGISQITIWNNGHYDPAGFTHTQEYAVYSKPDNQLIGVIYITFENHSSK